MNKQLIKDLINTQRQYTNLHSRLNFLEEKASALAREHESLHTQLIDTRNHEQRLINKIEQELGKAVTTNDLIELIKTNTDS